MRSDDVSHKKKVAVQPADVTVHQDEPIPRVAVPVPVPVSVATEEEVARAKSLVDDQDRSTPLATSAPVSKSGPMLRFELAEKERLKQAGFSGTTIKRMERIVASEALSTEERDTVQHLRARAPRPAASAEQAIRLIDEHLTVVAPREEFPHEHALEKPPLTQSSVILDTNILIARRKTTSPNEGEIASPGDRKVYEHFQAKLEGKDVRVADVTAAVELSHGPTDATGVKGFPITVARDSAEYGQVIDVLRRYRVGQNKGTVDREIVADAFFAQTNPPGVTPVFQTADPGIYKSMARIAGIDPAKMNNMDLCDVYPNGFEVSINGKKLHLVPIDSV